MALLVSGTRAMFELPCFVSIIGLRFFLAIIFKFDKVNVRTITSRRGIESTGFFRSSISITENDIRRYIVRIDKIGLYSKKLYFFTQTREYRMEGKITYKKGPTKKGENFSN